MGADFAMVPAPPTAAAVELLAAILFVTRDVLFFAICNVGGKWMCFDFLNDA